MKLGGFFARTLICVTALGALALLSVPALAQSIPVVGSQNTVTADPTVPRPHGKTCVVQLFAGVQFADFSAKNYSYTPPVGCPGPWEKVVFTADFNVTAGRQFDRTAQVFLGHVNLYYGTTPEPRSTLSPSWHVERDVTDYTALFKSAQSGEVDLGNLVNSTFTGIITGSATLEFYQTRHGHADRDDDRDDGQHTADAVYPLPNSAGGAKGLFQ